MKPETSKRQKNTNCGRQEDLDAKIASLPKRDGTFLLHNEKGVRLYGIKKGGNIVETFIIDKQGNPMDYEESQTEIEPPANDSNDPSVSSFGFRKCFRVCVKIPFTKRTFCFNKCIGF